MVKLTRICDVTGKELDQKEGYFSYLDKKYDERHISVEGILKIIHRFNIDYNRILSDLSMHDFVKKYAEFIKH